jgi:hypothetical protein
LQLAEREHAIALKQVLIPHIVGETDVETLKDMMDYFVAKECLV